MANSSSEPHTDEVRRPSKALGMYLPKLSPADGKPDQPKKLNPFMPLPPINQRSRSWDTAERPISTDDGSEVDRHGRLGSIGSRVGLPGPRQSRRGDRREWEHRPDFHVGKPKVKDVRISVPRDMDEGRDGLKGCDDRLDSTSRWVNGQGIRLQDGHRGEGDEDGGAHGCSDSAAGEIDTGGASARSSDLPRNGVVRGGGDGCDVDDVSCSDGAGVIFNKEEGHLSSSSGINRKLFTGIAKTSRAYFAQNIN